MADIPEGEMSPEQLKAAYGELRTAFNAMKDLMDRSEAEVKELGEARQETKNAIDAANKRIDEMDVKLQRSYLGGPDVKAAEQAERKAAFLEAIRHGIQNLQPEQKKLVTVVSAAEAKALQLGDDTTGGYLAPSEMINEIIKGVVLFSPVRSLARVRPTSNRSAVVPVRKGLAAAAWISDIGTRSETGALKYGHEEIPTHEMYAETIVSEQDLEDAAFDLEAEIVGDMSEQFGVAEGTAFVSGSGVGRPEGLLTNPTVAANFTVSGDANLLTADGLINLFYAVKDAYARNGTWLMQRATVGAIRKLKDTTNQYLWQPGLSVSQPPNILGAPYTEAVDMPAVAAGAFPVIFGDIRRGYMIIDRVSIVVKRLTEKYAESGQIALLARKRVGGQVVLPEAVRIQKISA